MAEKIKLLTLDIDINSLKKSMANVNSEVENLTEKQKMLKKSTLDLGLEIEKKVAIMRKSEKSNKTNTASYAKLKQEVTALKEIQKLSTADRKKQLIETKSALKLKRKEEQLGMKMVEAHTQKEQKSIIIARQVKGSIDQISASLSQNRALYRSLTPEQRNNSKIGQELLKVIKQQDDEYKKLNNEMGVTQVNVGNYKEEMKKALNESNMFTKATGMLHVATRALSLAFFPVTSLVKESIKSFKSLSKAKSLAAKRGLILRGVFNLIAATPLLLAITAIVIAVTSVVSWFKRTQAGADALGQTMAGVGAIINVLVDSISKIGGAIIGFITGQKSLSEAWNEGKDAVRGMSDEMAREYELAKKLEKKTQDLAKAEQLLKFQRASVNTDIAKLKKVIDDVTKSTEDRMEASKELEKIETSLAQKELDIANQQLAIKLGKEKIDKETLTTLQSLKDGTIEYDELLKKLGLSESTKEDVDDLLEAFTKAQDAQQRSYAVRIENQNKMNTIRKEANAQAISQTKKRIEHELKVSKTRLDIYIAENKDKARSLSESLEYEKTVHDKKVAILKEELKNKKKTQEEYNLEIINLSNDLSKRQAELTTAHAQKELEIYIAKNKSKIDNETLLTDKLVNEEVQRQNEIYAQKVEILEEQKANDLISEQDYTLQKLAIDTEYLTQKKALKDTFKEQEKEQNQVDKENERAIDELEAEEMFTTEMARAELRHQMKVDELERKRLAEVANAEKTGADIDKINKKYRLLNGKADNEFAEHSNKIEKGKSDLKLKMASQTLGGLLNLLGKESEAGKAVAVAQATINTFQGVTKAIAQGGFWGIAQGVIVAASGLANIHKIVSTPKPKIPKAEHGAVFEIGGNRHSRGGTKFYGEDGTQFEAEKDEILVVLNRAASSAFAGLSQLNEQHGGNAFTATHSYLANGGIAKRATTNITTNNNNAVIDYDLLALKITEGVKQLPHPVTLVQDIISETESYNKIINDATF